MKKLFTLLSLFLGISSMLGQVGLGTIMPNESAQLDIVATNKGLLIPRVDLMDATIYSPIVGDQVESLLVYNKATAGIVPNNVTPGFYYWIGAKWQRLLTQNDEVVVTTLEQNNGNYIYTSEDGTTTTFSVNQIGIGNPNSNGTVGYAGNMYVNNSTGDIYTYNGTYWVSQSSLVGSGVGVPTEITVQSPLAGNIYVDENTGNMYAYNGVRWVNNTSANNSTSANNGLIKNQNGDMQLGGNLIVATEISANAVNTLAIKGLSTGSVSNDELVVIDPTTGVLKKVAAPSLIQEKQNLFIANDGQIQFTPPLPIDNPEKINVYRNGVKIDFTMINATTIQLEAGVVCYKNDEIRIVQFY